MRLATESEPLPGPGPEEPLRQLLDDSVGGLMALQRTCGDCVAYWKGAKPIVFAFGPQFNRDILADNDAFHARGGHPGSKGTAQRSFLKGIFGSNGADHLRSRKMYLHAFRKTVVESYAPAMAHWTDQSISSWRDGQAVDLVDEMKTLAMNVTGHILFGLDDLHVARRVEPAFDRWIELNHQTLFASVLPVDDLPDVYPELLEAGEEVRRRIEELLEYHAKSKREGPLEDDLIGMLRQAQAIGHLSAQDVIGHMHSLFNAAHHTTTYSMVWAMFLIHQHPQAARRLLQELDEAALGDRGEQDDLDRLNRCGELERVIKESLRVLSPVVYLPRETTRETQLGPYRLPSGAVVIASQYVSLHRGADFPEPEHFHPERWRTMAPCPYSYIPFGGGSRMCLGVSFAMQFMKIAIAMIVRRFRLSIVPGTAINRRASLTLGPSGPIPILIHAQDGRFSTSPVHGQIHDMVALPASERKAIAA